MDAPLDRKCLADKLLLMTRQMLAAAQAGQWDDMAGAEAERGPVLAELFADLKPDSEEIGEWVPLVREAQALNQTLVHLASGERDRCAQALLAFRNASKAGAVYSHAADQTGAFK